MERNCHICRLQLEEFDPHLTCKRCRQPDPRKFYCSDPACKACNAIQSYKPLDYFLKNKSETTNRTFSAKATINSVLTTQKKSTMDNQLSDGQIETNIENRLYGRILSTLLTSFKDHETKPSPERLLQPLKQELLPSASTGFNNSNIASHLEPLLDAFYSGAHKLSSDCGNILSQNTLLSDPLTAECLAKEIGISAEVDIWPANIKPSCILKDCSELDISMKFHPKARQFQAIIFGEFNPKLPNDIMCPTFCLRPLSEELRVQFLHSRQKLRSLLFMYSLKESLLTLDDTSTRQDGRLFKDVLETTAELIESLLLSEANWFGLTIQNIRKFMLTGAVCKLDGAINSLIYGSVHPSQFFGSFVYTLQQSVRELGKSYCIRFTTNPVLRLKRLPKVTHPFEMSVWKKSFDDFLAYREINDEDKKMLTLYLLPKIVKSRLYNGGTKPKNMTYGSLLNLLERNLCTKEDVLQKKIFQMRIQNSTESVASFADDLKRLVPKHLSDESKEIMLREQFLCGIYSEQTLERLCQQICLTFTECVNYAESRHHVQSNPSFHNESSKTPEAAKKRKRSTSFSEDASCKQMKIGASDHHVNLSEWQLPLSLEKMESYDIICPWTGVLLRSFVA